jgi:hypothetical protein
MARLLKADGRLLLTMIDPVLGDIGHAIWWHGEHHKRGGMVKGETGGLWTADIVQLCQATGFELQIHRRFLYGLNHFYCFVKATERPDQASKEDENAPLSIA